jgi:HEAT repeat protein
MMESNTNDDHKEVIKALIKNFKDTDGLARQRARLSLTEYGWEAVPFLIKALSSQDKNVRWEAVEALGDIQDPSAAMALVRALKDESMDVRWAAAGSLIDLDRGAIVALLHALTQDFSSVRLREGAHHVLHVLKDRGRLNTEEIEVARALEDIAPEAKVPWAAEKALEALSHKPKH